MSIFFSALKCFPHTTNVLFTYYIFYPYSICLYIEKSNMPEQNCCMEKTLHMWNKHLVHGEGMYYERNVYCMEELFNMLWMCVPEYKCRMRGGNI